MAVNHIRGSFFRCVSSCKVIYIHNRVLRKFSFFCRTSFPSPKEVCTRWCSSKYMCLLINTVIVHELKIFVFVCLTEGLFIWYTVILQEPYNSCPLLPLKHSKGSSIFCHSYSHSDLSTELLRLPVRQMIVLWGFIGMCVRTHFPGTGP